MRMPPGTSKWEETPGEIQNWLEGLHISAERLGIAQSFAVEREVWNALLSLLPLQWMDGWIHTVIKPLLKLWPFCENLLTGKITNDYYNFQQASLFAKLNLILYDY